MSSIVKYKTLRKGIQALLKSEDVRADLKRRADAVAANARGGYPGMEIVVDDVTRTRARYRIVAKEPKAMAVEAKYRVLGRALDASK